MRAEKKESNDHPAFWRSKHEALVERSLAFASSVLQLCTKLPKIPMAREVAKQVTRSAGSIGASIEEACGGHSKADFARAMNIAKKEARETKFWLRLIKTQGWIRDEDVRTAIEEAESFIVY